MKIYMAGPLFDIASQMHNLSLAQCLESFGYEIILPQRDAIKLIEGDASYPKNDNVLAICMSCRKLLSTCDVIVANIDGTDADSGTAMEVGIALESIHRPIVICVRTDFRTDFNREIGINGMFLLADKTIFKPPSLISLDNSEEFYNNLADEIDREIIRISNRRRINIPLPEKDLNDVITHPLTGLYFDFETSSHMFFICGTLVVQLNKDGEVKYAVKKKPVF